MVLDMVGRAADVHRVADRGHRHSDGHSEVSFIISHGRTPRVGLKQFNPDAQEFLPSSHAEVCDSNTPSLDDCPVGVERVQAVDEEVASDDDLPPLVPILSGLPVVQPSTYVSIRIRGDDDGALAGFTDLVFDNALRTWDVLGAYEPVADPDLVLYIDMQHASMLAEQSQDAEKLWSRGFIRAAGDQCFLWQHWRAISRIFCRSWRDE